MFSEVLALRRLPVFQMGRTLSKREVCETTDAWYFVSGSLNLFLELEFDVVTNCKGRNGCATIEEARSRWSEIQVGKVIIDENALYDSFINSTFQYIQRQNAQAYGPLMIPSRWDPVWRVRITVPSWGA